MSGFTCSFHPGPKLSGILIFLLSIFIFLNIGISVTSASAYTQTHLSLISSKGRPVFSDDRNWFPISTTMTASFPATQTIWPTLPRQRAVVDQGDSCLHLSPALWNRYNSRGRKIHPVFSFVIPEQAIGHALKRFPDHLFLVEKSLHLYDTHFKGIYLHCV